MPPDSQEPIDAAREFVEQKIATLRRRLLDLSARNPLLNYRHPVGTSVRIVDELPDQVATALREKQGFTLEPVPIPSERELIQHGYIQLDPATGQALSRRDPKSDEWAAIKGIQTSYELPTGSAGKQHKDTKLQTLLYPSQLEGRLRSVRSRADVAESETGCHILFLAVGFLEWYESEDSDQQRLAPLFTIPVDVSRDRIDHAEGTFRYRVTPRDEDVFDNVTLREKLRADFGLALPLTGETDGPEEYFALVRERILIRQPRWRLHRYITLATLNFQKQAMYADLDTSKWGDDKSILDHALVRMFFTAVERTEEREADVSLEYNIDALDPEIDRYPVVFDADSSQHSAIIDALSGKNIVIEGPPGTGKSQTIANLIAACIAANKSVLFVAEKQAALEVVKSRLSKAGLGDFCLELHGHKAQKTEVLQALEARLGSNYPAPAELTTERQVLLDRRDSLNAHARLMNTPWGATPYTPHDIFSKAVRYRSKTNTLRPLPRIPSITGKTFTAVKARQLRDNTYNIASLHAKVAAQTPQRSLGSHYWCGARNTALLQSDPRPLMDALSQWNITLATLAAACTNANSIAGLSIPESWTTLELRKLTELAAQLPHLIGIERLESIGALATSLPTCTTALATHDSIQANWITLNATFSAAALSDPDSPTTIRACTMRLRELGIAFRESLDNITECARVMAELEAQCLEASSAFQTIRKDTPKALHECLTTSQEGLSGYAKLSQLILALPRELWRHRDPLFDNPDIDSILEDLRTRLGDLVAVRKQLTGVFRLSALPPANALRDDIQQVQAGGLLRWFSSKWRAARRRLLALTIGDRSSHKMALAMAPLLHQYVIGLEEAEALSKQGPGLSHHFCGVDTAIDRIQQLRAWYRSVRQEYGNTFSRRAAIASALFALDADIAYGLACYADNQLATDAARLSSRIQTISKRVQTPLLANPAAELLGEYGALSSARTRLADTLHFMLPLVSNTALPVADLLSEAQLLEAQFATVSSLTASGAVDLLTRAGFDISPNFGALRSIEIESLRASLRITAALSSHTQLLDAFTHAPDAHTYHALRELPGLLVPPMQLEENARAAFAALGDIDINAWIQNCGGTISQLLHRNSSALDHPDWLPDWLNYVRIKNTLMPEGLSEFIAHVEANAPDTAIIEDITNAIVFEQLADEILRDNKQLASFFGAEQDLVRDAFRRADTTFRDMTRRDIAASASRRYVPKGNAGGRVSEYTERSLIEHEIGKQKRHIALRALLDRAGGAVRALKPCFMMSPMSVATHLEPGRHQFDILIMDEASQIRPEDALGSIARAQSLVIVGDPKQLPPTSFFESGLGDNDTESDDEVALESAESILEAVTGMFTTRRLRWHYRSRHESLIAFSAKHFYDDDLILFPSPFETNQEFGVKLHMVHDGFFQRVNAPEARQVADFLIAQLHANPEESVGVVAMSADQRTLIEEELEKRMKNDPEVANLIESALKQPDPPFIKNLESVQGDERDVIVISMTYGPLAPGERVPQRFGPINHSGGWRRLNVLFTRAKKRMHVFSSMRSNDILVEDIPNKGRQSLRRFLAYCEQAPEAAIHESGRAPDSDFEVSVIEALESRGYKCTPQLGVAGYFLDLAIRHPRDPGRFLLGVECDGATYHSAKSARDRDRLRQDILEGLGWKIVRIWSTDWFRNPDIQIQRIENAIHEALQVLG